jgi:hypothetical protein
VGEIGCALQCSRFMIGPYRSGNVFFNAVARSEQSERFEATMARQSTCIYNVFRTINSFHEPFEILIYGKGFVSNLENRGLGRSLYTSRD